MSRSRTALLFSTAWFSLPLIALSIYLALFSKPDLSSISELAREKINGTTTGEILDQLPVLFRENSATAAAFLSEEAALSGSIYEKNRISRELYQQFIDAWHRGKFSVFHNEDYQLVSLDLENQRNVHILVRNRIPWLDVWFTLRRNFPSLPIVILFYFLSGAVGSYLFVIRKRPDQPQAARKEKVTAKPKLKKETPQTVKPKRSLKSSPLLSDSETFASARDLLQTLVRRYHVRKASFYTAGNEQFQPTLELRGSLFVRGEAITALDPAIAAVALRNNSEYIPSADPQRLFVAVHGDSKHVTGLVSLYWENPLPEDMRAEVETFARTAGEEFFRREKFSEATTDAKTGFLNAPAFFFSLKEKLLTHAGFSLVVFEFPETKTFSAEQLSRWGRSLKVNLPKSALIARIARNRFSILLPEGEALVSTLENSIALSESFSREMLSATPYGIVVSGFGDFRSLESYMKAVDYHMTMAKRQKVFPLYVRANIQGVL